MTGNANHVQCDVRPGLRDRGADLGLLVSHEIIEHDHIATAQRRHEDLLDLRLERDVIDRSIEDGCRGQLRRA
jgi:hypothetical protein